MKSKFGIPEIDPGRCCGCGMCVALCPQNVLSMRREGRRMEAVVLENTGCDGCGTCAFVCPGRAVSVDACKLLPVF